MPEKLKKIRAKCEAARVEAEAEKKAGTGVKAMLAQMMRFANNDYKGTSDEWQLMSVVIDSGAAELAIPHTLVTE